MGFFPNTANQGVAGNLTVSGSAVINGNLNVDSGTAHFGGALVQVNHLAAITAGITAAAGANAGTGPPAPVLNANARDLAGSLTFGTGTTPAAGAMVVLTLASTFTNPPAVVVVASNTAAQALGLYAAATAANQITISCTTAPAASQANTTYGVEYLIVGMVS